MIQSGNLRGVRDVVIQPGNWKGASDTGNSLVQNIEHL